MFIGRVLIDPNSWVSQQHKNRNFNYEYFRRLTIGSVNERYFQPDAVEEPLITNTRRIELWSEHEKRNLMIREAKNPLLELEVQHQY